MRHAQGKGRVVDVQSGTASTGRTALQCVMTLQHVKTIVGTLWIMAAAAISVSGNGLTTSRALLFVALGLVPPVVMLLLWNPPPQTLSESIDHARRQR